MKKEKEVQKSAKERLKEVAMRVVSVPAWAVVVVVLLVLVSLSQWQEADRERDRAQNTATYYQNQHYQGLKEAEIKDMTAVQSYDYAVKMFNIDAGRYLYQDLRVIGFVLSIGLALGLAFHGFKIVSVKRNG